MARVVSGGGRVHGDLRVATVLTFFFFLFYLLFARGNFVGTDEVGVFETTRSLYESGSLDVEGGRHVFRGRDGSHRDWRLTSASSTQASVPLTDKYCKRRVGSTDEVGKTLSLFLTVKHAYRVPVCGGLCRPYVTIAGRKCTGGISLNLLAFSKNTFL